MIVYFTGTGNSRYAAEAIGCALGEEPVSINEYMKKGELERVAKQMNYISVDDLFAALGYGETTINKI